MLENSIIEPSKSKWSSPCILIPKPDGSFRFVTDFRKKKTISAQRQTLIILSSRFLYFYWIITD